MNDLISRQDVLDVLRNLAFDHIFQCGEYYGEDERQLTIINARKAIDVIEAMPSAEPERKWIPVTEALPKNAEFVLLTIRRLDKSYSQIPFISVGYVSWNQNAWWCAHDGDCDAHNVEVLAWMPLPEPYRGE